MPAPSLPQTYSFQRYLAAKKSVDDRALNRHVWQTLASNLPAASPERPLRVLEIGAGIGTMAERLWDWGLLGSGAYTGIDAQSENIALGRTRLKSWAIDQNYQALSTGERLICRKGDQQALLDLQAVDLFDFMAREVGRHTWDLLIAHAFLDLVNLPSTLPKLFSLLPPGGLFYFSLNFDGATLLEPPVDPYFDDLVQRLYHRNMDERLANGLPSGDSRSGRHLFAHLRASGAQVLAAGASDWVVFPGSQGYPGDEAYFLHFIIHTIDMALTGHPELDSNRFSAWLKERHAQIEREELVYIAHQLDYVGQTRSQNLQS
jgi:hypothetical protein